MLKRITAISSLGLLLFSCSSNQEMAKISPIQDGDKNLTCQELVLEINEAQFLGILAQREKKSKADDLLKKASLSPEIENLNSTIIDTNKRISHLEKIQNSLGCNDSFDIDKEVTDNQSSDKEYNVSSGDNYFKDNGYKFYQPSPRLSEYNRGYEAYTNQHRQQAPIAGYAPMPQANLSYNNMPNNDFRANPYDNYKPASENFYRPVNQGPRQALQPTNSYNNYGQQNPYSQSGYGYSSKGFYR